MDSPPMISGGFGYLIGWFVGGTGCTLQTLYAWLMRGFGIDMVGILNYRVLRLSLRCDSWYTRYVINLVKLYKVHVLTIHHLLYVRIYAIQLSQCSSDNLVA